MGIALWIAGALVVVIVVGVITLGFGSRKWKNPRKKRGTSGRIEGSRDEFL